MPQNTHKFGKTEAIGALVLMVVLAPCSIFGASGAGTAGDAFLEIAVGARPAAMGESYLALSDDSVGFLWNPAGLSQVQLPEVSLMHLAYFADINYEYLGMAMPFHGNGLGLGVTWLNVPSFNSTLDPNATAGSAGSYEVTGAYSIPLGPQLSAGLSAKLLDSSLVGQSSYGLAFDGGFIVKPLGRSLSLAIVAHNLGLQSGYDNNSDPLPMSLAFGGAWRLYNSRSENYFNLTADINKALDNRFKYNLGAEGWLFDTLALRAGYVLSEGGNDLVSQSDAPANFTAGVGFKFGAANIDYAFVPEGELGVTHRFSLSWKFGYTPQHVEKEKLLQIEPKVAALAGGQQNGVAFSIDGKKAMDGVAMREWRIDIKDADGRVVRTLSGEGPIPRNLAWDMKDSSGNLVPRDQSYKFNIQLRDVNGRTLATDGFIAKEIKPREMLSSAPKYDTSSGNLTFQPKSSINIGVKEWKLNIRGADGTVIKTISGTGAIPRTLSWKPETLKGKDGMDLAAGKQVQAIQYDLEFKDASGQSKVVSDKVRFAMGRAEEQAYKVPVPVKDFKVNKGHEILVASIPNLTAANVAQARSAPFVMPVLSESVKHWKFEVTDPRGRLVKTFQGDSDVPENIFWDGHDENGLVVPDAEKSGFSFWVVDQSGKEIRTDQRKMIRNPFTISGAQGKIRKISGLWFRFLDSDIQDAIIGKLREIAQIIRKNSNVQVTIQGHAWDEGSPEETLRLSQERADAVLRYLIEEEGISPKNISSIGYGDTMPLMAGKSPEASEHNRRVEVVIISK
jgi:outer membrane protein OmpA-like peptidoglycan-associated protein